MEVGNVGHATLSPQGVQSEEDVKKLLQAGQDLKSADNDQTLKLQGRGPKEDDKGNTIDTLA